MLQLHQRKDTVQHIKQSMQKQNRNGMQDGAGEQVSEKEKCATNFSNKRKLANCFIKENTRRIK